MFSLFYGEDDEFAVGIIESIVLINVVQDLSQRFGPQTQIVLNLLDDLSPALEWVRVGSFGKDLIKLFSLILVISLEGE